MSDQKRREARKRTSFERLPLRVPRDLRLFIDEQVRAGRDDSRSSVVRRALRLLRDSEAAS